MYWLYTYTIEVLYTMLKCHMYKCSLYTGEMYIIKDFNQDMEVRDLVGSLGLNM